MVEAILKDKKKILPCAAYLEGEYGVKGLYVGVPVKLGRRGVEQIIEITLSPDEAAALGRSAAAVRELIDKLKHLGGHEVAAPGHQAQATGTGITATRLPAANGRIRVEGPIRWDTWWIEPALVVLVLGAFVVYSTWAALQNAHYYAAPYLSPFYSPCLSTDCQHVDRAAVRQMPALPIIGIVSPAFLILWAPGAVPADLLLLPQGLLPVVLAAPPACAVRDVRPSATPARRASR